ncbi:MAG: HAMP domain-containing histidine kinase [Candidatus Omnitrophica bacterium]|nr:HAMP domain-containing histidine kinase [Candidatus Omnitrophota bacterium]
MEKELKERLKWLIKLRWIAIIGVFIILTGTFIFDIVLPFKILYIGLLTLFLLNIAFYLYNKKLNQRMDDKNWIRKANIFANIQISFDLGMLGYFIHFSGSLENPFILYFVFHMVIASILLSNRAAYLQATFVIFLLGWIAISEYFRIIPHYHLQGFISEENIFNKRYILGVYGVIVTTVYLTVYMATSIVNKLRAREVELALANEKLSEQDRLKSRYVLTVSHDIQSSLSTIQNCLKVVLDGLTGNLPDKAKEMISRAEQRTLYLIHFVKDLLNLSRIRATKELEKTEFSLKQSIVKVVEELKERAENKKISIQLELPEQNCLFYGNKDAIEELLVNLITNGIKYTPWSGKVGIKMKQVENKKGCFHISIWDTGIGIPKQDLSKIFDEFYRSKNAESMEKEGTGLGLPIVKEILKAHNGEIWVESELGKGTSFFLH